MYESVPSLYLIPTPICKGGTEWLGSADREVLSSVSLFLVENERSARRFLASLKLGVPITDLEFLRFDKDSTLEQARTLLRSLGGHTSVGVLSEAGVPCVADPGALLVRAAHELKFRVHPMIGPSSILLALMASGLNGQQFVFHGYAPTEADAFGEWLQGVQRDSRRTGYTQLWIETPYRSSRMVQLLQRYLSDDALLCIAKDLGSASQSIQTVQAKELRAFPLSSTKAPCVFGLLAGVV